MIPCYLAIATGIMILVIIGRIEIEDVPDWFVVVMVGFWPILILALIFQYIMDGEI